MAFDNNKNTPGDYQLQVKDNADILSNLLYIHGPRVNPGQILLPGNGLLAGPMHSDVLAKNATDIESALRGIRSSDLVNGPFQVSAVLEKHRTLDIFEKDSLILPKPLIVSRDNRPMYLN